MPYRTTPFVNGHFYHIYNRGSEKKAIFFNSRDRSRFMQTLQYYMFAGPKPKFSLFRKTKIYRTKLNNPIVNIVAYCLMPNHFHLLLQQVAANGITEFIGKVSNSYTKYLNTHHKRVGHLFQAEFKAVLIENDEYLLHVSRYIHLNPLVNLLAKDLSDYSWSSYAEYCEGKEGFCFKKVILDMFPSKEEYAKFIDDQTDYAYALERIKHSLIDGE